MKISAKLFFLIMNLLPVTVVSAQSPPAPPPGLDQYIGRVLKTFDVPGISVAIVRNGKVILAKGYGVKKTGGDAPVTEHTLFSIASNTKAFTATALAILAEEKKLNWDDHVTDYLPAFRMSDPWVTAQITIRDLLVHHSGIPAYAGDILLFPPSDYTRMEILAKLKDIPLVHGFRTTYAYDNILYLAAGEIVKRVSGMEWEDFIQTRLFDQIGMKESLPRFSAMKDGPDISAAHSQLHGIVKSDDRYFEQAIGDASDPAGGISSNAVDMAQWLITQLDSGQAANGHRIFKPASAKELWNIVTPMPVEPAPAGLEAAQKNFYGYALGFRSYDYGKYKVIGHGGKLDGFVSQIAFVPELKLGIAVLTNQESTGAYWSVIYHVLDYYMQHRPFDWIGGFKRQMDSSLAAYQKAWQKANIKPDPKGIPVVSPEKYTGRYSDRLCGDVLIEKSSDGLVLRFLHSPELIADLIPFQYETFLARFRNADLKADAYINFTLATDGRAEQFKMKIIDPDCDLSFDDLLLKRTEN